MKTSLMMLLTLAGAALAQDEGKMKVERPLKQGIAPIPEKVDLAKTGIDWHEGLASVLNQGKPILLFQLLGRFDDVYC